MFNLCTLSCDCGAGGGLEGPLIAGSIPGPWGGENDHFSST